jgi:SAM-dependent methyltransferase
MMKFGERQVAETLEGIRRDHTARYEWAARILPAGSQVVDFACGIGYGSHILAEAGHQVRGFDRDDAALVYAYKHWAHRGATFHRADGDAPPALGDLDAAVCFETIEHLKDPRPLLNAMRQSAPMLLASVPNEDVMPWSPAPGITTEFHFRHYTRRQFQVLLAECGWRVVTWYGQAGPESEVEPDMNGRTLIAVCERGTATAEPDEEDDSGSGDEYRTPKHVAILGLGPSLSQYLEVTKRLGGRSNYCDEVWSINALGDVFASDVIFHMDDVRIQEIRAAALPESNIAAMLKWVKTHPGPIVTSRAHPDYPGLVEFPLEAVLNDLGHDYFNSTAAYAIAFAIHIGVEKISVFGMDFTYPNAHDAEKGRACVEFWLGVATARGIKITLPKTTTLMDAMHTRAARLYGYDTQDVVFDKQPDGNLRLEFTERESLPTAAEIEAAYDHSAHPNALVSQG